MDGAKRWLVLAVDDEARLLRVLQRTLERAGFSVLVAGDGPAALAVAAAHPEPIELLVTDIVMPGMSGPELHARLRVKFPDLPAIFLSGTLPHGLTPGSVFLPKPFEPAHLVAAARALLAR